MSAQSSAEDQLTSFLAYTAVGLIILGLIVAIWFLIKAFELVVRVLVAHPDNKPLWIALGTFVLFAALAYGTQGQEPTINVLAATAFVVLLAVAKIVEIYYEQLFLKEFSREQVVHQVLNEPWWNAA